MGQIPRSTERILVINNIHKVHLFVAFTFSDVYDTYLPASGLPQRFELMNGGRQLKILDVSKTRSDETSDLQVIQCNASNQHGYAFDNAYINVLR